LIETNQLNQLCIFISLLVFSQRCIYYKNYFQGNIRATLSQAALGGIF